MALQMCRLCQAFAKASTNPASFSSFDDYPASPPHSESIFFTAIIALTAFE